jgi:nicotinamidase/pyrazinamidase
MAKAVVIVDMLNDFVNKDGALYMQGAQGLVECIGKIKGKAYEQGVLVVYANDSHAPDDVEFKVWPRHCVKGEYGAEIVKELAPTGIDVIFEKQTLFAFDNPETDRILRARDIDELFIAGVATEYCIRGAALGAARLGYKTNVVVDAIAGVDIQKGDQYRALLEMGNGGVRPVYSSKVLEELVR